MSTEPVGTLAEEAAKLVAVMQSWASDHTRRDGADTGVGDDTRRAPGGNEPGHTVGDPDSTGSEENAQDRNPFGDHEHATAAECRWCPLCQSVRLAKAATPEVRDHLASAAVSLALAFKGLMEGFEPPSDRSEPVEKIDLDLDLGSPED
jgi:hypothetical protein